MTCEDTPGTPARITWEVQLYEPCSHVWICKGYGRATTTARPLDVARAALTGYLATRPPQPWQKYRAFARPDHGEPVTVTAGQLPDGWTAGPDVQQALPLYLRQALARSPAGTS